MLHRLNLRHFVRRGPDEISRQLFYFVAMRFPHREGSRQALKQLIRICRIQLYAAESALPKRTFVTLARRDPLNQTNPRSEGQGDLLMTAADAQNRLTRFANHIKDPGEIASLILVPRMTLTAEDDVRRRECFYKLGRDVPERFSHDA